MAWKWNERREKAAQEVAEDRISDKEIAAHADVSERQIGRWKLRPEFQARVQEHLDIIRAKIVREGLADKNNRIALLKARLAAIDGIILARGELDPPSPPSEDTTVIVEPWPAAPGATVVERGLQLRTVKSIGAGKQAKTIHEFAVDTATLAEERALMQQLATELGDWKTKMEHSGKMAIDLSGLTDEEFEQLESFSKVATKKTK